jgi:phosphomannomutase
MAEVTQGLTTWEDVGEVWTFDGVRANFSDDSWVLVRKSGTEGKIRIYCEGPSLKRLKQLVRESSRIVRNAIRNAQRSRMKPA